MDENGEIHQILGCPSKFSGRLMCVTRGCERMCRRCSRVKVGFWRPNRCESQQDIFSRPVRFEENKMILDFNFQKIHENTRNTTTYVWLCLVHLKVIPYFRLELVASGSGVWTPRTGRPLRSGNKRTGWTGRMAPAGRSPSAIGNNGIPVKNPPISLETFSQWLGCCLLMAMPYLGTNPL